MWLVCVIKGDMNFISFYNYMTYGLNTNYMRTTYVYSLIYKNVAYVAMP